MEGCQIEELINLQVIEGGIIVWGCLPGCFDVYRACINMATNGTIVPGRRTMPPY